MDQGSVENLAGFRRGNMETSSIKNNGKADRLSKYRQWFETLKCAMELARSVVPKAVSHLRSMKESHVIEKRH